MPGQEWDPLGFSHSTIKRRTPQGVRPNSAGQNSRRGTVGRKHKGPTEEWAGRSAGPSPVSLIGKQDKAVAGKFRDSSSIETNNKYC